MSLNYKFINNVSNSVWSEIQRRQELNWSNGPQSNESLQWQFQKTAYIILRSIKTETTFNKFGISRTTAFSSDDSNSIKATGIFNTNNTDSFQKKYNTLSSTVNDEIVITSFTPTDTISTPVSSIINLYKSNGIIRGAVLQSFDIESTGPYGSVLQANVHFTVFDKDEMDYYINKFLKPGQTIEIEYGWSVNENIKENTGKVKAVVFNFNFSSKEDGSWDCTLHAMGASSITYGFNIDEKVSNETTLGPNSKNLQEIFKTILDSRNTSYTIGAQLTQNCKKVSISEIYKNLYWDVNKSYFDDVYINIYKLPITKTIDNWKFIYTYVASTAVFENVPYITLGNLINLINKIILQSSKRNIPVYELTDENGNDLLVGSLYTEDFLRTGPANLSKFAFTTQYNGNNNNSIGIIFALPEMKLKQTEYLLKDLVLINVEFILSELSTILDNNSNITDKKIVTFLDKIFKQLETDTGGIISLTIVDGQKNKNTNSIESILILNNNSIPKAVETSLAPPKEFIAFTKKSMVRSIFIESNIPSAVQSEVATYTRSGIGYVGTDDVSTSIEDIQLLISRLKELNKNFMNNIDVDENRTKTSMEQWQTEVRGIYRKIYSISNNETLNGNNISKYNIFNCQTSIYPITLKVVIDGIEGFEFGNSITTNWLPKQYRNKNIYWTVTKIRHVIENNDWKTELTAIYRVKV